MIRGVDELIAFARENTTIVPGHGPVGTKALMREYREMLVVARDRVGKLKAAAQALDAIGMFLVEQRQHSGQRQHRL